MFNSSWFVQDRRAHKCKMILSRNTRYDRCWRQFVDEKFLEIFVDVFCSGVTRGGPGRAQPYHRVFEVTGL